MSKVTIVDYGVGNLFNVRRAFEHTGAQAEISSDPKKILQADRLVLPGVGAFAEGMKGLHERGLTSVLQEFATLKRPFLGICLGMQLLLDSSDELGHTDGLKLISGKVTLMPPSPQLKIPQIGWNTLTTKTAHKLFEGLPAQGASLYFLHSYVAQPSDRSLVLSETQYGPVRFASALQKENLIGFQPHLERSGSHGLKILKNFLSL